MVLPKYDYVTKRFMWGCTMGVKRYMTKSGSLNGLKYLEHKPGLKIKENAIRYWVDYLHEFKDW